MCTGSWELPEGPVGDRSQEGRASLPSTARPRAWSPAALGRWNAFRSALYLERCRRRLRRRFSRPRRSGRRCRSAPRSGRYRQPEVRLRLALTPGRRFPVTDRSPEKVQRRAAAPRPGVHQRGSPRGQRLVGHRRRHALHRHFHVSSHGPQCLKWPARATAYCRPRSSVSDRPPSRSRRRR